MTPRIAITLVILAVVLAGLTVHRLQCAEVTGRPYVAFSGRTMGTTWDVKVARADLSPDDMRAVGATIEAALERVNAALSSWRDDSEISRFDAHRSTEPFPVGDEVLEVLGAAERVSRETGGAFDVTVRPLVEAWGFGQAFAQQATEPGPPSPATLEALGQHIGYEKLLIDETAGAISKTDPALEVDVSAIAKGYGVDAVAEALEALGHTDYLVEIGGELRARGRRIDGTPFRVAIEMPDPTMRRIHRVIDMPDLGMATSGDYRSWREVEGRRISHTIDPRTARPIEHALASVTVLLESAMAADAWATALNVLGPEAGPELAERRDMPAYFIVRTPEGGFEPRQTTAFTALFGAGDDAAEPASN